MITLTLQVYPTFGFIRWFISFVYIKMLVTCTLPLPVDSVLLSPAMLTLHVIECARCPIVYPRVPQRR